jgi:hypothetical protein
MSESDPYSNKKKNVESEAANRNMGDQDDTHMNPDLPDTSDEDTNAQARSPASGKNQAHDEDEDEEE